MIVLSALSMLALPPHIPAHRPMKTCRMAAATISSVVIRLENRRLLRNG